MALCLQAMAHINGGAKKVIISAPAKVRAAAAATWRRLTRAALSIDLYSGQLATPALKTLSALCRTRRLRCL